MEEQSKVEIWTGNGPDECTFSCTKIIFRESDQYYYATTRAHCLDSKVDSDTPDLVPIPMSRICPAFLKQFTRAPEPLPQNCHVKGPDFLCYGDPRSSVQPGIILLNEARVYEILRASPHPNIAQYLRCVVKNDKITGLCCAKYDMDLEKSVSENSSPFDMDIFLQDIQKGMYHLHSLGSIHCDLKPANILTNWDTCVITDFDSCHREGQILGYESGTYG